MAALGGAVIVWRGQVQGLRAQPQKTMSVIIHRVGRLPFGSQPRFESV